MPDTDFVMSLNAVSAGYGDVDILSGVDLAVEPGSVVALIGPNGAGKTTLLKVAAGSLRPSAGTVSFRGRDVTGLPSHRRAKERLCLIPGGEGVFKSLTVAENLAMCQRGRRLKGAVDLVQEIFPSIGRHMAQAAGTLSGGEQQMLALARAFVTEPELVIADELSMGLAPVVVDQLFRALAILRDRGIALLVVEQYVHRALSLADDAYVLNMGQITYSGSPGKLLESDIFRQYLGAGVA